MFQPFQLTMSAYTAHNVDSSSFVLSVLVLGFLVPAVPALSLQRADAALRGRHPESESAALSFLSLGQVPGATPSYVKYGRPEFTTFSNATTACQACAEFFPTKEDGKRFHAGLYNDASGGVWERTCRAGKCDFRDPQTDPVGGIIGKGDTRTCITRDPVPWFTECEPVLRDSVHSVLDATRYCSYKEQMFIPPPAGTVSRFADKPKAWRRIGGTNEQCLATIENEGSALFDSASFCDANLPALSGCCETVFTALSCVAETSSKSGAPGGIFSSMSGETAQMAEAFTKYCVPLCQNTKEQFCEKYPGTDICVDHKDCSGCTGKGGLWCPKLETCHCPSKNPPCIAPPITTPLQCLAPKDDAKAAAPPPAADAKDDAADGPGEGEAPLCKYAEMARMWKRRQ